MEALHTVKVGDNEYVIIGVDPEIHGTRWVEPTNSKKFYTTRQAAHRRREQLEERAMNTQKQQELLAALEAFLASPDFKSGIISSTKASWGGSGYSVELFPDETWRVLWDNQIGNKYQTEGKIIALPALDYDPSEKDEYVDGGAGSEDGFLAEQFYCDEDQLATQLRHSL